MSNNALFAPLFEDAGKATCFSTSSFLTHFIAFEQALIEVQARSGRIPSAQVASLQAAIESFTPDQPRLEISVLEDGLPVPCFVRQLRHHAGDTLTPYLHLNVTSQDLIDTAMALACRDANLVIAARLDAVLEQLSGLQERYGARPLTGRTRMQAALPISVAQRVSGCSRPLELARQNLPAVRAKIEVLQLGGPLGGYDNLPNGMQDADGMAKRLGLGAASVSWHTNRQPVAQYCSWLSELTGALGKLGMDIALMAQQGVDAIQLSGGGRSSAMPHKQNPALAEILAAQARFNAGQLGLVHQALLHEQERSGAA